MLTVSLLHSCATLTVSLLRRSCANSEKLRWTVSHCGGEAVKSWGLPKWSNCRRGEPQHQQTSVFPTNKSRGKIYGKNFSTSTNRIWGLDTDYCWVINSIINFLFSTRRLWLVTSFVTRSKIIPVLLGYWGSLEINFCI